MSTRFFEDGSSTKPGNYAIDLISVTRVYLPKFSFSFSKIPHIFDKSRKIRFLSNFLSNYNPIVCLETDSPSALTFLEEKVWPNFECPMKICGIEFAIWFYKSQNVWHGITVPIPCEIDIFGFLLWRLKAKELTSAGILMNYNRSYH